MKTRIIVGILLVLLLIVVLFFGGFMLLSVLALFSLAAIFEMGQTFRKKSYDPILIPAYVFAIAYPFVYFYLGMLAMFVLYLATVMTTMIWSLFTKRHTTNDIIPSLFILNYPTLFLMCMLLVYFSFGRPIALVSAGIAYAAPECADTFAYFGGTFLASTSSANVQPEEDGGGAIFALIGGTVLDLVCLSAADWGANINMTVLVLLGLDAGCFRSLEICLLRCSNAGLA